VSERPPLPTWIALMFGAGLCGLLVCLVLVLPLVLMFDQDAVRKVGLVLLLLSLLATWLSLELAARFWGLRAVTAPRYPTADAAIEEIRKMRASLEPRLGRVPRRADLTFVIVATGYLMVLGILAAVVWLP
jgi:hypothetical protein